MAAYVIFIKERTHNARELDLYRETVPAALAGHPLTFRIAHGHKEVVEGPDFEDMGTEVRNSLQLAIAPSACPLLRGQPTGPEHCCQIEPVHQPQLVRCAGGRRRILHGHAHHGLHIVEHHDGDILGLLVIEIGRARCQRRLDIGQCLGAEPFDWSFVNYYFHRPRTEATG